MDSQYTVTMRKAGKVLTCMASGLLLCSEAGALTTTPYQAITDRNVFDVHPLPPPAANPEKTETPPIKIILTGITTILGNKRALLKTPAPAGKPAEAAKGEQSYILTEGQREGQIEVVQIDEKAGTVKVDVNGTIMVLNFDKDGQKPSVGMPAPAPGAPPGVPSPTGVNPASTVNPYHTPMTPGGFNLPTRPLRAQPAGVNNAGGAYPSGSTYGAGASYPGGTGYPAVGGFGIPSYGGATATTPQQTAAAQTPTMTPEQQIIQMEAQREINKNNPNFPPLPPTPLNPNPTATGTPAETGQPSTTPTPPSFPTFPGNRQLPPLPQ